MSSIVGPKEVCIHSQTPSLCSRVPAVARSFSRTVTEDRAAAAEAAVAVVLSRAELDRLAWARRGHFMPPSLLDPKLATHEPLEVDEPGVRVLVDRPPEATVELAL